MSVDLRQLFFLFLLCTFFLCQACDPASGCTGVEEDPRVGLGFSGLEGFSAIEPNDRILVEPGSQGYGLMVLVNVRYQGIAISEGAHSEAMISIVLDRGETITTDSPLRLSALCQDDGVLVSRNRRIELESFYTEVADLEGLDQGINARIIVESELLSGDVLHQEIPIVLVSDLAGTAQAGSM